MMVQLVIVHVMHYFKDLNHNHHVIFCTLMCVNLDGVDVPYMAIFVVKWQLSLVALFVQCHNK